MPDGFRIIRCPRRDGRVADVGGVPSWAAPTLGVAAPRAESIDREGGTPSSGNRRGSPGRGQPWARYRGRGTDRSRRWCLPRVVCLAVGLSSGSILGCAAPGSTTYPSMDKLTPGVFLSPEEKAVLPRGVVLRPVYGKGLELTKLSEGFVPQLYNDAARYCTIAYGHLVKKAPCDGGEPAEFRRGVTEPQGAELLVTDMASAQLTVMTAVQAKLTDGQFAALSDFIYNVGGANFRKSTLLQEVNAGQHDRVPAQFRRWVLAGGKPWPGLRTRREREIELYFDGLPKPRAVPRAGEDLSPLDVQLGER